jgi:hypothetical protein
VFDGICTELDITDEELAAEALAADLDAPIADDALPFGALVDDNQPLLPEWYMPAASGHVGRGWRARVCVAMAAGLVFINGCGICVTNGWAELPWLH